MRVDATEKACGTILSRPLSTGLDRSIENWFPGGSRRSERSLRPLLTFVSQCDRVSVELCGCASMIDDLRIGLVSRR